MFIVRPLPVAIMIAGNPLFRPLTELRTRPTSVHVLADL